MATALMLRSNELFLRDISFNMSTNRLRNSFWATLVSVAPAFAQSFIPEILVSEGTTRTLESFNSPGEDFSAVPISKDEIVFVSSRKGPNSKKKDPETNQYFFDLYVYNRITKEVSPLFKDENKNTLASKFNLGPISYLGNSEIIISRNNLIPNKDGIVTFNLTSVDLKNPNELKILSFVKKEYSYLHPFFDAKRNRLYFSSNERGGKGGFDVYYSERLLDGGWGPAVPLAAINSSRDDVFPTVAPNGTILFSKVVPKQGLNIFAYDIKSSLIQELPSPFNSSLDDFGIVFDSPYSGYISQSQSGRYNTDIVRIEGVQYKSHIESSLIETDHQFASNNKVEEVSKTPVNSNQINSGSLTIEPTISVQSNTINISEKNSISIDSNTNVIGTVNRVTPTYVDNTTSGPVKDNLGSGNSINSNLPGSSDEKRLSSPRTSEIVGQVSFEGVAMNEQPKVATSSQNKIESTQKIEELNNSVASLTASVNQKISQIRSLDESIVQFKSKLESLVETSQNYQTIRDSLQLLIVQTTTKRNVANADYYSNLSTLTAINQAQSINSPKTNTKNPSLTNYPDITNQWGSPDLVMLFSFDGSNPLGDYRKQLKLMLRDLPKGISGAFIVGHADARGSEAYNVGLSIRRAKSVQKLIGSTLTSQTLGFGESHLKNECGNGVRCPENLHMQNRRVEIWFY